MAKKSDFQHDVLLIVATILFFSFFTGTDTGADEEEADGSNPLELSTPIVVN